MIDRHGNRVLVGWAEHEILWIEAALTLDFHERQQAFRDIAAMTTRTIDQVRKKVIQVRDRDRRQAIAAERRRSERAPEPVRLPPSQLRQPTMAQLMGCR